MNMRRFVPHVLLATMTVLALLAVVASIATADKVSAFAVPKAGDPAVVSIFHRVVQRSLEAPSFTVDAVLKYRAPDRTEVMSSSGGSSSLGVRVIGRTVYLDLGRDAQGNIVWGRGLLSHPADLYYGPLRATQELTMLLGGDSVVRSGDHFIVRQVVPADTISPGNAGQLLITYTVYVADDYVTGVTALLQGWVTIPAAGPTGAVHPTRVDQYQSPGSTYGDYGHLGPIVAPSTPTIPLTSCANGGYLAPLPGSHACSIFG